ncbi:hypothetical protein HNQ59_002610 [Chitinivorax tropicus]|uniref:DUF4440 domain-containing protein n=1 Tax=Chitinivorax tropicus TaxID=714531 RepID=A0A840MR99_9PROT|nr:DUF4440 domain-containing protein [Chitinivorax tropicus]MBB5019312.1 hypothetical protein [Chitinivorax tropicus]
MPSHVETLIALECSLHEPQIRCSAERLGARLHEQFREFGRSGAVYNRLSILAQVANADVQPTIWAQDFALETLSDDLALLTYRSAHIDQNGQLHRHTNRSSLWQWTDDGWQMRFHQGTPTEAFEKKTTEIGPHCVNGLT